jgi:hypothetical protein
VKITAAMATDLDIPTEALDDHGTDIAHSPQGLASMTLGNSTSPG